MNRGHEGFRRAVRVTALICGILAVTACAGSQKGKVVEKTLDTMSEQQRRGTFDTMAAVLDRNPEMVDELYAVSREHPQMFVRFLANSARDLKEPELARTTASLLVANPESLAEVMRSTLELAADDPQARAALAKVMAEERVIVADILTDHPQVMQETMNATLRATEHKPAAREALLASMRTSSERVASVLVRDPKTVGVLMSAMLKAGVDRDTLRAIFRD
jgi:glutamate synthase domain-containing protein 1